VATKAVNIAGVKTKGVELTGYYDFGVVDLYGSYSRQDAKHDDPAVGSAARKALASVAIIGGAGVRDIPKNSVLRPSRLEAVRRAEDRRECPLCRRPRRRPHRRAGHLPGMGVEMIDGYALVGLTATYDLKRADNSKGWSVPDLRFQFNVDNLFDKEYIGAVSGSTATQPEFGYTIATPNARTLDRYFVGAPRTYTLSVRARF
jgi:iron complex outermembrane receptor protein